MTRLSVALLTYNAEADLPGVFEGLVRQSRLPDEVVAFDDRSSDGSAAALEAFAARAPFPVVTRVHDRRLGPIEGSQEVFAACRGDVIAPHEQYDRWKPNKLEALEGHFGDGTGLVFSDAEIDTRSVLEIAGFGPEAKRATERGELTRLLVEHPFVPIGTVAFRTDLLDIVSPIPHHVSIDMWIGVLTTLLRPYAMVDEALVVRHGGDVVTHRPETLANARSKARSAEADLHRQRRRAQAAAYHSLVERYEERGVAYLETHGLQPRPLAKATVDDLRARAEHLSARGTLPDRRGSRIPIIVRELRSGRYNRYSAGVLSALQDVAY